MRPEVKVQVYFWVTLFVFMSVMWVIGPSRCSAGEKEELTLKWQALQQEGRALEAERQLYNDRLGVIQQRAPKWREENQEVETKLKAILEKEAKEAEGKKKEAEEAAKKKETKK